MSSPEFDNERPSSAGGLRAAQLLRVRTVWLTPIVVASVLVFLMTLFYVGSVVSPVSHLRGLPVQLVNEDSGVTVDGQHVNAGAQIASALRNMRAVSSRLTLGTDSLAQAMDVMNNDGAYATIVLPAGLTASLLSAYDLKGGGKGSRPCRS